MTLHSHAGSPNPAQTSWPTVPLAADPISRVATNAELADLRFVGLDTETGGLDPANDALLEVAIARGFTHPTTVWLVQPAPGLRVLPEALAVNHIAVEEAGQRGVTESYALSRLFAALGGAPDRVVAHRPDPTIIVGQNTSFDLAFLRAAARRNTAPVDLGPAIEALPWVDTSAVGRWLFPEEDLSLAKLCERLDVPAGDHRAATDAVAAWDVWQREMAPLRQRGVRTWDALLGLHGPTSRRYRSS